VKTRQGEIAQSSNTTAGRRFLPKKRAETADFLRGEVENEKGGHASVITGTIGENSSEIAFGSGKKGTV